MVANPDYQFCGQYFALIEGLPVIPLPPTPPVSASVVMELIQD